MGDTSNTITGTRTQLITKQRMNKGIPLIIGSNTQADSNNMGYKPSQMHTTDSDFAKKRWRLPKAFVGDELIMPAARAR